MHELYKFGMRNYVVSSLISCGYDLSNNCVHFFISDLTVENFSEFASFDKTGVVFIKQFESSFNSSFSCFAILVQCCSYELRIIYEAIVIYV